MKKSERFPISKSITHSTASLICLTLILAGFQNCSPMETSLVVKGSGQLETPQEDLEDPSVMINTPANNTTVSGAVAITVLATDDVGVVGVQLLVDGAASGGEDLSPPFEVSWNTLSLTNKSYSLTARARDAAGKTTTSPAVSVMVNNVAAPPDATAPTVSITSPSNNSTVTSGMITLSATANDNIGMAGVQFLIDGSLVGTEDVTAPYSISVNSATIANGTHTITARARDAAGNTTTSTAIALIVNKPVADTTAPTVSVTAPTAGSTVSGTINLIATASDNVGVSGVRFTIDGANVGVEDTTAPYSVSVNTTTLTNGARTVRAIARDAAGNTTTSAVLNITVNNVPVNPNATYTWIASNVLNSCTSCHGAGTAFSNVRYNTYANTMLTVNPGQPLNSRFYDSINIGAMPAASSKLSAQKIQAVYDWILKGAPND